MREPVTAVRSAIVVFRSAKVAMKRALVLPTGSESLVTERGLVARLFYKPPISECTAMDTQLSRSEWRPSDRCRTHYVAQDDSVKTSGPTCSVTISPNSVNALAS